MNINPYNANDVAYNDKKLIHISDTSEFLTYTNIYTRKKKVRDEILHSNSYKNSKNLRKIYIPSTCTTIEANTPQESPFYGCSPYLTIYTNVNENEIPETWGPY